ncbi:MAG: ABC transporter permease subunit [Spirochaeta sp.]|nr:ABC transporter permease subunit [Spirochaeta sp.]
MQRRKSWQTILLYMVVIIWLFIVLFPFYWLFTTSLKKPLDVSRGPKYIPYKDFEPTTEHWKYLFTRQKDTTLRHFRNSIIAALGSMVFSVVIGSMAGYGLSRFSYYWKRLKWRNDNIAFWIISQRFLPPALFVVPFLMIYAASGLIDTHIGLIIIYTMFNIPFTIWIMRDFFNTLPASLEESAMVDGATRLQAFLLIVLPLCGPGLASVSIFSFVFSWNEFLYALMLTNFDAITMPVLIAGMNNTRGVQWWYISALTLFAVSPVVLIGLFMERFIVKGLVSGAIKE